MLPDGTAFDSPTTAAKNVAQLIESRFAGIGELRRNLGRPLRPPR